MLDLVAMAAMRRILLENEMNISEGTVFGSTCNDILDLPISYYRKFKHCKNDEKPKKNYEQWMQI